MFDLSLKLSWSMPTEFTYSIPILWFCILKIIVWVLIVNVCIVKDNKWIIYLGYAPSIWGIPTLPKIFFWTQRYFFLCIYSIFLLCTKIILEAVILTLQGLEIALYMLVSLLYPFFDFLFFFDCPLLAVHDYGLA